MPERSGYDAVVVGAGIIGLACAWRARQRGLSVLVIDRDGPGSRRLARGRRHARPGHRGGVRRGAPHAAQPRRARPLAGVRRGGWADGCITARAARSWWRPTATTPRSFTACTSSSAPLGLDSEWLTPSECRRLEPALSPRCGGGILAPHEQQVDPVAVVSALVDQGLEIAAGDPVAAVDEHGVRLRSGRADRRRAGRDRRRLVERLAASTGFRSCRCVR